MESKLFEVPSDNACSRKYIEKCPTRIRRGEFRYMPFQKRKKGKFAANVVHSPDLGSLLTGGASPAVWKSPRDPPAAIVRT
jgi:hypothetical protein